MAKYLFTLINERDQYKFEEIVDIDDKELVGKTPEEFEEIMAFHTANWQSAFLDSDWSLVTNNNVITLHERKKLADSE